MGAGEGIVLWSIQPRAALSRLASPTPQVTRFCSSITFPELEAEKFFPSVRLGHQMASLVAGPGFRASAYKADFSDLSFSYQANGDIINKIGGNHQDSGHKDH